MQTNISSKPTKKGQTIFYGNKKGTVKSFFIGEQSSDELPADSDLENIYIKTEEGDGVVHYNAVDYTIDLEQ